MDPIWLLLLLPAAAASGWLAARRVSEPPEQRQTPIPTAYFRGLNLLLNEQPDAAIDEFARILETDSETVDIHLALGSLFRRRGEIERATKIHQNLLERGDLIASQRSQAKFELARDYFKAGLFDRAEELLLQLAAAGEYPKEVYHHLLQIYDREKEWEDAITSARQLQQATGQSMASVIAQYYCEQAESAISNGRYDTAREMVDRALNEDDKCVRATIQAGRIAALSGDHVAAIKQWRELEQVNSRYFGEVLDHIVNSFRATNDAAGLQSFLREAAEKNNNPKLLSVLIEWMQDQGQGKKIDKYLLEWVRRFPSMQGLHQLIQFKLKHGDDSNRDDLVLLENMIGNIISIESGYLCQQCGFVAKTLHWQCPSCHSWDTSIPKNLYREDKPARKPVFSKQSQKTIPPV